MAHHTRLIKSIPVKALGTESDANVIEVSIHYNKGGMNGLSYRQEQRGYYLSVSPLKKEGRWSTYQGFSGIKTLIEPAGRFGAKKFNTLEADADTINKMVAQVALKNDLQIVE